MSDLRPIGTEFEYVCEPSNTSTDTRFHIVTFRVIAHHKVQGGMAEGIEEIARRHETPDTILIASDGTLTWERPK